MVSLAFFCLRFCGRGGMVWGMRKRINEWWKKQSLVVKLGCIMVALWPFWWIPMTTPPPAPEKPAARTKVKPRPLYPRKGYATKECPGFATAAKAGAFADLLKDKQTTTARMMWGDADAEGEAVTLQTGDEIEVLEVVDDLVRFRVSFNGRSWWTARRWVKITW